jgi:DNA-directed RNA polymerase specialized sigma24 family protein
MRSSQSVGQSLVTRQEEELLVSERRAALREAFADLSPCCQQLIEDPPMPYAQISAKLGIPAGSIGPRRGRCLDKLRRDPAIAALINPEAASAGSELSSKQATVQQ